ncbi:MAG: hypothetical protein MZW92_11570 [Comamonadaceae bacterium]|nr:hypothetical protein [Comamonadaceae bacterium]
MTVVVVQNNGADNQATVEQSVRSQQHAVDVTQNRDLEHRAGVPGQRQPGQRRRRRQCGGDDHPARRRWKRAEVFQYGTGPGSPARRCEQVGAGTLAGVDQGFVSNSSVAILQGAAVSPADRDNTCVRHPDRSADDMRASITQTGFGQSATVIQDGNVERDQHPAVGLVLSSHGVPIGHGPGCGVEQPGERSPRPTVGHTAGDQPDWAWATRRSSISSKLTRALSQGARFMVGERSPTIFPWRRAEGETMVPDNADLQVWFETQVEAGKVLLVPYVKTAKDIHGRYSLLVTKSGPNGNSRISQSGKMDTAAAQPQALSRLTLDVRKEDQCTDRTHAQAGGRSAGHLQLRLSALKRFPAMPGAQRFHT